MTKLNIKDALKYFSAELKDKSSTPMLDIRVCLSYVLKCSQSDLYLKDKYVLTDMEYIHINNCVKRRISGEPIAYIVGVKSFWDFDVYVDENVLVPRPETETLIEGVLAKYSDDAELNVLDIGTGSGVIAISLARETNWQITATDISNEALNIAKQNINNLNVSDNIRLVQSDLFNNIDGKFDLIVANPPYISISDPHLADLKFEPITALVSADNGYSHLLKIIRHAKDYLVNGGEIFLEHGSDQSEYIEKILASHGYKQIRNIQDCAGIPRISCAIWQ